ncbi:hypothetical protein [Nocardia inohanensis]|uniref:hypothetical protein n=1 Tax=Nocardia inohanensis TaxID=209246 RepID=UPI0008338907|nr:hypothetical protein [Nocardia inohanensis]
MQFLATMIVFVWIGMVIVGAIGLVRGRVRWARIGSRKAAGWVLGASMLVFILIGVVAPKQDSAPAAQGQGAGLGTAAATSAPAFTTTVMTTTVAAPVPLVSVPAAVMSTTDAPAPPPPAAAPVQPPISTSVAVAAPLPVEVPAVAPAPSESAPRTGVTPGAFCSSAGATGYTKTGKLMVCETSATDSRLRWRQA